MSNKQLVWALVVKMWYVSIPVALCFVYAIYTHIRTIQLNVKTRRMNEEIEVLRYIYGDDCGNTTDHTL